MSKKVDLSLLKRLVSELETSLMAMDKAHNEFNPPSTTYTPNIDMVVEASKSAGFAAGIMQEATMLIMDIQEVLQTGSVPKNKNELLEKLVGSLKSPGSTN